MEFSEKASSLHIVEISRKDPLQELSRVLPSQTSMFPVSGKRILVFVVLSRVSDIQFVETLQTVQPHVVVDIRKFPRFDIGKLNRQLAFDWFERSHTRYIDLVWSEQSRDAENQLSFSHPLISDEVARSQGPVMILMEAKQCSSEIVNGLAKQMAVKSNHNWDVLGVPNL